MNESSSFIFILPIIAALIGWATNFVAIKMLFHPQDPKKILGITFQGVFLKTKAIAERLGELVVMNCSPLKMWPKKLRNYLPALKHWRKLERNEKTSEKIGGHVPYAFDVSK